MNANTTLTHATGRTRAERARQARFVLIDMVTVAAMPVVRWWRIRQDELLLISQPDHLLRDVGIERKDIRAVLRGDLQP